LVAAASPDQQFAKLSLDYETAVDADCRKPFERWRMLDWEGRRVSVRTLRMDEDGETSFDVRAAASTSSSHDRLRTLLARHISPGTPEALEMLTLDDLRQRVLAQSSGGDPGPSSRSRGPA
jgi:hypothetical protein